MCYDIKISETLNTQKDFKPLYIILAACEMNQSHFGLIRILLITFSSTPPDSPLFLFLHLFSQFLWTQNVHVWQEKSNFFFFL